MFTRSSTQRSSRNSGKIAQPQTGSHDLILHAYRFLDDMGEIWLMDETVWLELYSGIQSHK